MSLTLKRILPAKDYSLVNPIIASGMMQDQTNPLPIDDAFHEGSLTSRYWFKAVKMYSWRKSSGEFGFRGDAKADSKST
jgi:hypothetical protein